MRRMMANGFSTIMVLTTCLRHGLSRDEDKIMKACYWPNEIYEPCFGGCAEISCDNPRNHLRPCYPYCEPGCVCDDPYVRDDRTHQCVLPQDCSPTQMGIPVPTKKQEKSLTKYSGHSGRRHAKPEDIPSDMQEPEIPLMNRAEDYKRASEMSRMGNYFNIVIAPPPIKALQPRKLLLNDVRAQAKRMR